MDRPGRIIPPVPGAWTSWDALMDVALSEAFGAKQRGEVPVGAVLVSPEGTILAQSGNDSVSQCDPAGHAEVLALRAAGRVFGSYRLEACVLVVTLEPCLMCAGALSHARLAGLVYGASDPRSGAISSCFDALDQPFLRHRVWHLGGVKAAACAQVLHDFFLERRNGGRLCT